MSAFGTKKPGANAAVQMTFPEVFASEYELAGDHEAFANGPSLEVRDLPAGHDLQAQYHEQKRRDANHMAMAAVQSARSSEQKMLMYHNNYNMPKPVLGQRRIAPATDGAAGIGGNLYVDTEMRGGGSGGMTGGVLRSAQGQRYGKQMLLNRIPQLNAISAAKSEWLGSQPVTAPFLSVDDNQATQEQPVGDLIELNLAVQQLEDAIMSGVGGISRFTLVDLSTVFKLLLRLASTSNREELDELDGKFRSMVSGPVAALQNKIDDGGEEDEITNEQAIQSVINYTKKLSEYTHQMLGVVNKSLKERQAFSKALVKQLGLTRPNITRRVFEDEPVPAMIRPRLPAPGERPAEPDQENSDNDDDEGGPRGPNQFIEGSEGSTYVPIGEEAEEEESGDSRPGTQRSTSQSAQDFGSEGQVRKPIGRSISGTNYNVKALKHYYKTLTGETSGIHNRAALLQAIYREKGDRGYSDAAQFNEIPVVVQHGRTTGEDVRGKPLYGSQAAQVAFHRDFPKYREDKTYPLGPLLRDVATFTRAYEEQFIRDEELPRRPNLAPREEAAPRFDRGAAAAAAYYGEEAAPRQGRNATASAAYFGEQPYASSSSFSAREQPFSSSSSSFPAFNPRGEGRGRGYGGAAPMTDEFNVPKTSAVETQQKESLARAGVSNVYYDRDGRQTFGYRSGAFFGEELPSSGPENLETKRQFNEMKETPMTAAHSREAPNPLFNDRTQQFSPEQLAALAAGPQSGQGRVRKPVGRKPKDFAKKLGFGKTGGIMSGQNLEKTGFPDEGKMTVENGFPARGGAAAPTSKPKMRTLLNQIRKAHPDQAAKVDGFLEHLKGQGRMVGAGWFDSLKSFVSSFFGKKVAAAAAPAAPPGESTHGKTGPAEQLSRIGINSKNDFRNWAKKGGHPDKGGDTATFQKVSGLAAQLGWSGGKKLSFMGLLGRLAVKKAKSAIKGKGLSLRQKLAEPAVDEPKRPGYGRTLNPNARPKAAKAVLPPGTAKHILPGRTHNVTKDTLPDTREGYVALADKLRGQGHSIRVNSGSQLKSIRANFIKKLGL